ncbi:MAG TPA: LOG family protein [Stellaceae bacterium]|nr:LOG family protein [Stellaceae bacterium]
MDKPAHEKQTHRQPKAYQNGRFLESKDARALRILAEYLEPLSRFKRYGVEDTIVFMGSARLRSREAAEAALAAAESAGSGIEAARMQLALSAYYEAARELAHRLTRWSKQLDHEGRRFVVCTGGGPGIMEAANRGASEAKGHNVGLTISIPNDEFDNPFVTRELHVHFHYFFMRKFWFVYLAKAVVLFPGGFGTLDELFEILTLVQTRKMKKRMPIVLFGAKFWDEVVNFEALVKYGTISPEDLALFHRTDSIDETYDIITRGLTENALGSPGAVL